MTTTTTCTCNTTTNVHSNNCAVVPEWAHNPTALVLSPEAIAAIQTMLEAPPRPCERLREAARQLRAMRMERASYNAGYADDISGARQMSDDPVYMSGWIEGRMNQ